MIMECDTLMNIVFCKLFAPVFKSPPGHFRSLMLILEYVIFKIISWQGKSHKIKCKRVKKTRVPWGLRPG